MLEKKPYGLLGEKLPYSFSKEIHEKLNNADYGLFEISGDKLDGFFEKKDFKGINITIPYKERTLKYCDYVEPMAKKIGAINTIVNEKGILKGYNTDYRGLDFLLRAEDIMVKNKDVCILGTGGTCKTALALMGEARSVTLLSRNPREHGAVGQNIELCGYEDIDRYRNCSVLINTTPVGTYPNSYEQPVLLDNFAKLKAVIDVIYNPLCSSLINKAKSMGIKTATGLLMLITQAYYSEKLFFPDKVLPQEMIYSTSSDIFREKSNLVLIGMPGCGKTTIGQLLSKKMNRKFFDTDYEFEKKNGIKPSEYIMKTGEAEFRKKEQDIVLEISKQSGVVIATGGGVVINTTNMEALKNNGYIIYLDRKIEDLDIKGRPLSGKTGQNLCRIYGERKNLYSFYSDIVEAVSGDPCTIADSIISKFNKERN